MRGADAEDSAPGRAGARSRPRGVRLLARPAAPAREGAGPLVAALRTAGGAGERELLFTELVRRFQDAAFAWAFSVLGDFHLGQDAVQEAFVVAWSRLPDLREPAAFPGWLRRIVVSQAHRALRAGGPSPLPLQAGDGAGAGDPAGEAEARDLGRRVRSAVRALPEAVRAPVVLYYFGGRSVAEIAALLGLSAPTVKNRLHAARRRLRDGDLQLVADGLEGHRPSEDAGFRACLGARLFPFRTDLPYYEDRAAGLLSVWRNGLPSALALARQFHPRLAGATDGQIQARPSLEDARLVLAREHGCADWPGLARQIAVLASGEAAVAPFMAAFRAIEAGDADGLRGQLDAHSDLARTRGTNGNTLLNLAANCRAAACSLLLQRGADPNLANDRGWTPLHQAGYSDQPALAELLLAAGADPGRCAHGDGGTPLVQALFWGHREAAEVLARRGARPANLRVAAGLGLAGLLAALVAPDGTLHPDAGRHRAFYRPHTGFPEWAPSDDPQEVLDEAFVYACRSGRHEALELLLRRGAAIDADPYRGTGLLWAAARGRADTVAWLLDHGADPNRRASFGGPRHGQGVTALHLAAQDGHEALVRLLVARGADLGIRDELFSGTPGGWAAHAGHRALAESLAGGSG